MSETDRILAIQNWRAVCKLAHLPLTTTMPSNRIVEEMRRFGNAQWTEQRIRKYRAAYRAIQETDT